MLSYDESQASNDRGTGMSVSTVGAHDVRIRVEAVVELHDATDRIRVGVIRQPVFCRLVSPLPGPKGPIVRGNIGHVLCIIAEKAVHAPEIVQSAKSGFALK